MAAKISQVQVFIKNQSLFRFFALAFLTVQDCETFVEFHYVLKLHILGFTVTQYSNECVQGQ